MFKPICILVPSCTLLFTAMSAPTAHAAVVGQVICASNKVEFDGACWSRAQIDDLIDATSEGHTFLDGGFCLDADGARIPECVWVTVDEGSTGLHQVQYWLSSDDAGCSGLVNTCYDGYSVVVRAVHDFEHYAWTDDDGEHWWYAQQSVFEVPEIDSYDSTPNAPGGIVKELIWNEGLTLEAKIALSGWSQSAGQSVHREVTLYDADSSTLGHAVEEWEATAQSTPYNVCTQINATIDKLCGGGTELGVAILDGMLPENAVLDLELGVGVKLEFRETSDQITSGFGKICDGLGDLYEVQCRANPDPDKYDELAGAHVSDNGWVDDSAMNSFSCPNYGYTYEGRAAWEEGEMHCEGDAVVEVECGTLDDGSCGCVEFVDTATADAVVCVS